MRWRRQQCATVTAVKVAMTACWQFFSPQSFHGSLELLHPQPSEGGSQLPSLCYPLQLIHRYSDALLPPHLQQWKEQLKQILEYIQKTHQNILLLPDIHAVKSVYCHRAGYKVPLVPELSHMEQQGETMGCRNSTISSSEEEISSARPRQRRLQCLCRIDWLVCRSHSWKTRQKLLLLQRLLAASHACQSDSWLERWKETLMTFIFQHKAVPYCNEHLNFPRRARENKHQHLLYSNKPKLFNTFSDEKLPEKFSNSAL